MHRPQTLIACAAVALVVTVLLFPPFGEVIGVTGFIQPIGRTFFLAELERTQAFDTARAATEIVGIVAVAAILLGAMGRR